MNRRLNKLIRDYNKFIDSYIDLVNNCSFNYNRYDLNIINKDINNDIYTLCEDTIKKLFGYKYFNIIKDFNVNECYYLNHSMDNFKLDNNGLINYDNIYNDIDSKKYKSMIVGSSYYPRFIDYKRLKDMCNLNKMKMIIDISNIYPLVISKKIIIEYADYVICKINDYWLVLSNEEFKSNIDINVLISFTDILTSFEEEKYKSYVDKIMTNTKMLVNTLTLEGIDIVTNGSDNNLILIKTNAGIDKFYNERIIVRRVSDYIVLNTSFITYNHYSDFESLGKKIANIIKKCK